MYALNMTITIFLQTEIILKSSSNVDGHNKVNSSKYAYICRKPCFKNSPTLILWNQKLNSIKYNSSRTEKLLPWESFKADFTDFNKALKCKSVRFLKLSRINLKELVVETYKVKLMSVPLPAVKISHQYTSPQEYGKLALAESKFLHLPILIHFSKNEI